VQSHVPARTTEDAEMAPLGVDALDDHDDVQGVYANFDIPDSILTSLSV
jgi:transcriptional/translational regulatory protein YebC/TACO1